MFNETVQSLVANFEKAGQDLDQQDGVVTQKQGVQGAAKQKYDSAVQDTLDSVKADDDLITAYNRSVDDLVAGLTGAKRTLSTVGAGSASAKLAL